MNNRLAAIFLIIAIAVSTAIYFATYRLKNSASEPNHIEVARCVGYCNLALFVASKERPQGNSLAIKLRYVANPGDHAAALLAPGGPQAAVTPFTNVLTAFGTGQSVRIIAGSGMNGLALVARSEVKSIDDLADRKIGTFRADTLEMLAYDAAKSRNIQGRVKFIYFADALEPLTALKNGEVDAITHVEPFVSQLVEQGQNALIRGEILWGTDHPDCVLITTEEHLKKNRASLKELIREMLRAQERIEIDLPSVAKEVATPFYQMTPEELVTAASAQFPQVDILDKQAFIQEKGRALVELGYIQQPTSDSIFDFSLLKEVLAEEKELLGRLRHKSR